MTEAMNYRKPIVLFYQNYKASMSSALLKFILKFVMVSMPNHDLNTNILKWRQ